MPAVLPLNTLRYEEEHCINCELCLIVCPHGVFAPDERVVRLAYPEACMECGACQRNCPTGAIAVDSGVGCAAAMIRAALRGRRGLRGLTSAGATGAAGCAATAAERDTPCCGSGEGCG